jgi:hypothetical protein
MQTRIALVLVPSTFSGFFAWVFVHALERSRKREDLVAKGKTGSIRTVAAWL